MRMTNIIISTIDEIQEMLQNILEPLHITKNESVYARIAGEHLEIEKREITLKQ
jgi:hypothetical protein